MRLKMHCDSVLLVEIVNDSLETVAVISYHLSNIQLSKKQVRFAHTDDNNFSAQRTQDKRRPREDAK